MVKIASYGTWESPVTAAEVAAADGEQHGFRKAETLIAVLHAELSFYGQVFGFDPAGVPALELRR